MVERFTTLNRTPVRFYSATCVAPVTSPTSVGSAPMVDPLQTLLIVASLLFAAVAAVHVALDRPVGRLLLGLAALLELGFLAQAVIGIGQLVSGDRDVDGVVFVGYLLGALLFLPLAVVWALGERSRGGTAVLVVAGLVLPVLVVRIEQVWTPAGG
jgi:hypothetical protein